MGFLIFSFASLEKFRNDEVWSEFNPIRIIKTQNREMIHCDVAIIGGGLTGLTLQYLLMKEGVESIIIEARSRLGGRIYTSKKEGAPPIEMGATWLGRQHTYLNTLLKELDLGVFPQELSNRAIYEPISTSPPQLVTLPKNDEPSYRIQGGTSKLIETLLEQVKLGQLHCKQEIKSIKAEEENLVIESDTMVFKAKIVVSTLPPFLLKNTININPNLPLSVLEVMEQTHTWMGESIKVGLSYKKPFWRGENTSGTIFSSVGPISEFYDHSNYSDDLYALKGFLNGNYHSVKKEERLHVIMNQLKKYYGKVVEDYIAYEELVWSKEKHTYTPYQGYVLPHQNNGHPLYQKAYLDGRLYIAGSETASYSPGYMDGAVCSANYVYEQIRQGRKEV